jgi:carbon storage regulator CsrA
MYQVNAEVVMLILKRRIGEEIIINENIRIVVSQTTDHSCSLAIEAPAIHVAFAG